ncbi:MAG: hypothetical protein ACFB4I_09080 [Cyanophyceae cyanobacterium]
MNPSVRDWEAIALPTTQPSPRSDISKLDVTKTGCDQRCFPRNNSN